LSSAAFLFSTSTRLLMYFHMRVWFTRSRTNSCTQQGAHKTDYELIKGASGCSISSLSSAAFLFSTSTRLLMYFHMRVWFTRSRTNSCKQPGAHKTDYELIKGASGCSISSGTNSCTQQGAHKTDYELIKGASGCSISSGTNSCTQQTAHKAVYEFTKGTSGVLAGAQSPAHVRSECSLAVQPGSKSWLHIMCNV